MNSRIFVSRFVRQLSKLSSAATPARYHVRFFNIFPAFCHTSGVLTPKNLAPNLQVYRYKSKKSKKVQKDEDSDDEDVEEEGLEPNTEDLIPGQKEKIVKVSQLRVDKLLRLALQSAKVVDTAFLEGKLRRNEEKLLKKATEVQEGDILDIELGPDPKNPDFIKVNRVEILEIKQGVHSYIRVLISKDLSIQSYSS